MTTIAFSPNATATPPFSAQITLDGTPYTLAVAWNIFRGDWYVSLTDQSGNLLVNQPLVGSPNSTAPIYLAPGLLVSSTLLYYPTTQTFVTNP